MTKKYLIRCNFQEGKLNLLESLKPLHQKYIKNSIDLITYGGVILTEAREYKGICYVIYADELNQAQNFVKGDPYFELYNDFEINLFESKIPG